MEWIPATSYFAELEQASDEMLNIQCNLIVLKSHKRAKGLAPGMEAVFRIYIPWMEKRISYLGNKLTLPPPPIE